MARNDIGLLMGQEQFAYGQYQDQLGQYNTDRAFDYGVFSDDRAQANYMDELGYNRRIYGDETAYSQALNNAQTMAALGDFSGYKALGYSDQEIATLNAAYQAAQTTTSRSSGGGSSGGSGGDEGGDLFEAMKASGNPYTFLSSNYKKYGVAYNSITAVYREYEAWLEGGDDGGGVGDSTLEEIWRNSQSQFSVSNRGVHSAEPGTELYRVFAQAARAAGFSQAEVEAFLARR